MYMGETLILRLYKGVNSNQKDEMLRLNHEILSQVTGEFGVLEVINSGSCFELPKETLEEIRILIQTKKIKKLFFESHWMYRKKLQEMGEDYGDSDCVQNRGRNV